MKTPLSEQEFSSYVLDGLQELELTLDHDQLNQFFFICGITKMEPPNQFERQR